MRKFCVMTSIIVLMMISLAWASGSVTQTISGAPPATGTWTSAIAPLYKGNGFLNVSVYGAVWSATVWLQRSFDKGVSWFDVMSFTVNSQKALIDQEGGVRYRMGVKSGGYSSGSVAVRLSN